MNAIVESIKLMTVNGNRLELPKEQITNYPQVKKHLLNAGGKYVKCGFVFSSDAQIIKNRLTGGEVINDKKKFQFFATPYELAQRMVDLADIQSFHSVLEPSAGQGAITQLIEDTEEFYSLTAIELNPDNVEKLIENSGCITIIEGDFLKESLAIYDRIIANPPFTKNQDIDHVHCMYEHLASNGKIVCITSSSWTFGSQKKQVEFREWLEEIGANITELPAGTFKESGTTVKTMLLEINK